ncbi:hypothetical protein K2173_022686 [Erythroxylum novogranatense]|uniref:Cytochrome P450 n=1 Tax=Erythroxylum novogranatense TaxID=1862640 RepID=A0AAV8SUT9_9ROSI|nr:hypothetical protein K2173_022686 [Erythroxylum novogranatense]
MESPSITSVAMSLFLVGVVTWAWRVLNWVWLRPKRLERYLRQQGLKGTPYTLVFGDLKKNAAMLKQARSRPVTLSDAVAPCVIPIVHRTVTDCGKNSFNWMGPIPRVNIMDPQSLKEVFLKIDEFQKPKGNPLVKLLATGLANYEGEKWAKHRKIINPAFHLEKLKLMIPVIYQSCNKMIGEWETLVYEKGTCELDVWPHLQNLTRDIISRTAFGSNYEEGKIIFDLLKEQARLIVQVFQSVYIPGWRFLPTQTNKRLEAVDKEIRASLKAIINKRERAIKAGESENDDLLGLLMESNFREIQEHGNMTTMGMSSQDVIEECKLFYFAGQETTSVLLVWTLILLSKYPDWQHRAREEVLRVFGDDVPDFDGLNHLKIVTMILYEVLRLYPPVVQLSRAVCNETKLGSLNLPAGVHISLPTILVHVDPELWGDDASEFQPQRFSEGISKATKNPVSFFPFGWGPRICIGQNFALAEAKIALALILRRFSFHLAPSYVHSPRTVITLQPEHGAPLILHKL